MAEPARKPAEKPAKSKRVLQTTYAPALSGVGMPARITGLVADGAEWSVVRMAEMLKIDDAKNLSPALSKLVSAGVLVRVGRGRYAKGKAEIAPRTVKDAIPSDERVPAPDDGGLTPLERATVISGKTRASFGPISGSGGSRGSQDPPTAEERILAALGSGPKKWSELLELCSLTTQGASEAMAALTRAGKTTSWNGAWKLKETA